MYISQFSAFNYRSLKQVIIRLENGKNVLVGKNNSGKSNIIKGIEILLGEKFPSYQTFTNNDFYTQELVDTETGEISEQISENFHLEVDLIGRDFDTEMLKSIKKKTAFTKIKNGGQLYSKDKKSGDIIVNYDFFQSLDELESRQEVDGKAVWKNSEELIVFLQDSTRIKLFFCKSRVDEEKTGFGMLCVDSQGSIWISHFLTKKLRDSLITSTVISALRSHKEELRLVHFTWFGKLIIGLWNQSKGQKPHGKEQTYEDLITERSVEIKSLVDGVFAKDTEEIKKLLSGAIAHKAVSFRFLNDKYEVYKNIQLFVNDGIDRPLFEKGTGIQSALIISLFSLYCNNFHNNSSLLIAEEPELYLHPQARRVISAELDKFLIANSEQPRQLIISTHSTEYLKNVEPYNIIRVFKDEENNCSITKQINNVLHSEINIELKRFLWSNNTELFFADKVVLVEGGEVYLLPAIVDKIKTAKQLLDYRNITVTRVNGKGSFLTYIKILESFGIKYLILGDLDCFKDEVPKLLRYLQITEYQDKIESIKKAIESQPTNYDGIADRIKDIYKNFDAQKLQSLLNKFKSGEITNDNSELLETIDFMESRYTKGDKFNSIMEIIEEPDYVAILQMLREKNIFIWSKGELETYFTDAAKQISGSKDIKPLNLSYRLREDAVAITDLFLHTEEINLLVETILS